MTGRLAKATVPVGTPAWVANERTQVRQLLDQDVEDFAYFARNEFEWLNEHMLEIFERTASHQVDMIQLMKTPARMKAKTPRTGLRKRFASPSKQPQNDDTPMELFSRPPQPLFEMPQLSKERFEQSMVSLNKAAEAIVTSSRRNSAEAEKMPAPMAEPPQMKEQMSTKARVPTQEKERDSGIWIASQEPQSQSFSQGLSQTLSHIDLPAPSPQRLSHRSSNQSEVYEDARSSPAPNNESFATAAQTVPVKAVPAKENTVVSPAKSPIKDFRIPLMEVPDRLSKNDRIEEIQKPVKPRSPLQNKPLGSPRAISLIQNDRIRYSPTTTQYRLPSPKRSPLRDHFEIRHDSASDSPDEVDDVTTEQEEEEHANQNMDHQFDEPADERMEDQGDEHELEHEGVGHEQIANQGLEARSERSRTRSPVKTRQTSAAATPQTTQGTRVTRSSVARQLSATPTVTPAPVRSLDKLHLDDEQKSQGTADKTDVDAPGALPRPNGDLLADHRKRSYRTSGIANNDEDTATGSRKVSRSSYTTKVPIKTGEDSSDDEEVLRRKRAHSKSLTNALFEKIEMMKNRQSMATKTPRARGSTREGVSPDEEYSYFKTPSTNYSHSTYSHSTRSDLKTPGATYDYTYDFKTPNHGSSQNTDVLDTATKKKSGSFYSPEAKDTSFSRNSSTPNKEVKLASTDTISHMRESPTRVFKVSSFEHAESPTTAKPHPETPAQQYPESSPSKTPSAPPPVGGILDTLQHTTANAFNKAKNLLLPHSIQSPAAKAALMLTSPPEMREWRRSPNPQSLDEQLRQLRNDWDKEDATANYTKEIEITPSKEIVEKIVKKTKSSQAREFSAQTDDKLNKEKEREQREREEKEKRVAQEAERLRIEKEEEEERRKIAEQEAEAEAERLRLEQEAAEAERRRIEEERRHQEEVRRQEELAERRRKEQEAIRRTEEEKRERERERLRKEKLEKEKQRVREIARKELEQRQRREREHQEELQRQEMKRLEEERRQEQAKRQEEERLLAEARAQEEMAREKARRADERRRAAEAEQQRLKQELAELQEQLRIENERAKREEEEERERLRREEEERMQHLREEELKRRREEEEQRRRREDEELRRRHEEEERRKRQDEEEEQQRLEEEEHRRHEDEEHQRRVEEQRRIQAATSERAAREKEAAREIESDEESKTSQPSRPASRLQKPTTVSKTQRTLRPLRTVAQPPKPVLVKTASQREIESQKKHLGQPASTSALTSALKDTFGASQPALANAASFTSVNSQQSQSSLRSVASSQQASGKSLKALDSANAARKKQQEDAERRAAQRDKIAKQRAENQKRAQEKEEARRQMGRQRTVERELEPKKKPASQAPPSAGRNLLNRVPAASNLRKNHGDESPAPKKRPLPDQEYGTIKVVQPDAKRQRSEEYEQAEMRPPIRASNMNKNSKMPHGYGAASKATIKTISSSSTTTTISAKRETEISNTAKTPGAPNSRVASLKTPQTQKASPQYINGELIELPDIPSDSDDEDEDDDDGRKKQFLPPKWAESPELQLALAQQQAWDPQEIFGDIPPLKMEEIFKTRDVKRFRARTSSANWSGQDGLTQEEVEAEEEARLQMIREGKWTYNQLGKFLGR